jgi:hypothetical protein
MTMKSLDRQSNAQMVQALRELLRDENYVLIFTTESGIQEASPLHNIVKVRIFPRTAQEKPMPLQATADGPETTVERLERTAIEAENPEERLQALASLTQLDNAHEEAVLLSLRLLHNDSVAVVREAAMNVLSDLRGLDAYDIISRAAQEDPSPLLRIQALESLAVLSRESMPHALEASLLRALEDQDIRVSDHAERLLTTIVGRETD